MLYEEIILKDETIEVVLIKLNAITGKVFIQHGGVCAQKIDPTGPNSHLIDWTSIVPKEIIHTPTEVWSYDEEEQCIKMNLYYGTFTWTIKIKNGSVLYFEEDHFIMEPNEFLPDGKIYYLKIMTEVQLTEEMIRESQQNFLNLLLSDSRYEFDF